MKVIYAHKINKSVHFPIVSAVPDIQVLTLYKNIIEFLTYRRTWKLQRDYVIWCDYLKEYIFIPKNFIFDGASVPKALYSFLSPNGILLLGACPHDFGYRYKGLIHIDNNGYLYYKRYSKSELDKMFRSMCKKESSLGAAVNIAYIGLFLFGFTGWLEARKNNCDLNKDFPNLF